MASSLPRLLLCAALGSGLLFSGAASAQGEPEIKELALGFGLDLPFAVHIVAIEKGWFEEEGSEEVTTLLLRATRGPLAIHAPRVTGVRGRIPSDAAAEDALAGQRVAEAIYRSAGSRREEQLEPASEGA